MWFILLVALFSYELRSQDFPLVATFLGEHTWDRIGYWLNPGGDAATRYLRRYLDKIADNEGVEIKEPPYPWDENYP